MSAAFYSGELHYWRHERDEWDELLDALLKMGFSAVSTCVPWSVHERHKGAYRFEGNLDVAGFVANAQGRGLDVRLRLGPAVGASITGFGIPERVLANEECQAVSGRGTPLWLPWPTKMVPAPSFASKAFQAEVAEWFQALGEHLSETEVKVDVDGGRRAMGRVATFDGDYHPDAIQWWLDADHGLPAPRYFKDEELPRILAWVHFGEKYEERAQRIFGQAAMAAGMDVTGVGIPKLQVGGEPWFPVVSEDDQKNSVLEALASGTQTFNLFMAVGRERWSGGALEVEWVGPLLKTLQDVAFHTLKRNEPIVLIDSRAEARAADATCALEGATSAVTKWLGLGPSGHAELSTDADARLYPRWMSAVKEALDFVEVPYRLLGEHELHEIDSTTRAVVMPTLRRVDGAVWGALHALDTTGMPVIIGPELPREDEHGKPLDAADKPPGAGMLAAESLDDIEGLAADLLGLAGELSDLWIAPESADVTCTPYCDASGEARLLFVRNRGEAETEAKINAPVGCELFDPIADIRVRDQEGIVTLPLAPREIRMLRIALETSP